VRADLDEAVSRAVTASSSKPRQLASESSEDALTWTVVRYLEQEGRLAAVVSHLELLPKVDEEPVVLFWGSESPGTKSNAASARLTEIARDLGETKKRTEPDAILDFGLVGSYSSKPSLEAPTKTSLKRTRPGISMWPAARRLRVPN